MLCFRCGSYNPENAQKCTVCGQGFIDESGRTVGPPRRESKTTTPAAIFVPGEMVAGRYRIGELLGQGGVGAVYRARDLEIDVDVALKGITPNLLQTDEEQKNFSKQIKAARKLQHPNIVRIYDEGHEGTRRFFTMKLLEGLTLRKIIRLRHEKGQPFTAEELVPIFHQLGAALDYAHKSTWHGDLKPENILILPDLLKVTDFNLVKALPLKPFLGIAKSRSKGFPYIAPELRVEAQTIDGRCDLYALGVILGEMLTGLVYEGHYTRAMTAALEQLPTKLDGLVRKSVTEHPDGRYQRGSDLARDLEAALASMQGPLPSPVRAPTPSVANTVPNPKLGSGMPSTLPPGQAAAAPQLPPSAAASALAQPHHQQPPPVPRDETGPSHSPAPMLSSDSDASGGPPPLGDDERMPSEILEIGQSQVLLLASGVTNAPPDVLAEAARRLMAAGHSNPEDTLEEGLGGNSDMDTAPRGAPVPKEIPVEPMRADRDRGGRDRDGRPPGLISSGERPRDPEKLIEALYGDDKEDGLIPPPLPDDPLDKSMDRPVRLAGDDSDDDDEPTDERLPRINKNGEIHDALTALKPHPPELMDDDVRARHEADARAQAHADAETKALPSGGDKPMRPGDVARESTDRFRDRNNGQRPPPIEDEDSLKETLSAEVLRAAKERSSPSLHRAEPLPPPVIAPPPVLRPVTPPRRPQSSSGPLAAAAILAVVAVAGMVVVWRFVLPHDDGKTTHEPDHALVTPGKPDDVAADAGIDVKPSVDDTKPHVDDTKPVVVDNATKPPDNATKPPDNTTKPPDNATKPPDNTTKPPDNTTATTTPPDNATAPVVATAAPGSCPKGMAFVEGGSFSFGSAPGDPMRNFGEGTEAPTEVKPFCIDYYESPNGKDAVPIVGISWQAAKNACDRSGRRLCAEKEWERACKGPSSTRFPYGNTYDADTCNTEDGQGKPRALSPATAFKKCRSPFKVFMMAGNAEEWVVDSVNGNKVTKGGAADRPDFSSRCAARRAPGKGQLTNVGFRCCSDPH